MYILLGIWLVGILPLVYGFLSKAIAALASVLFFAFIFLVFMVETTAANDIFQYLDSRFLLDTLVVGIVSGVMLFSIGGSHNISEKFKPIGRIYMLAGLQISLFIVFLLSIEFISDILGDRRYVGERGASDIVTIWVLALGIPSLLLSIANLFFSAVKTKVVFAENIAAILMLALALLLFFFSGPGTHMMFLVLFTAAFVGIILMMLYIGYQNMDMTVVNKASFWATLFIVAKYFEWFWGTFNPYLFFMVGGIILIMGGIALEKKRKELKARFAAANMGYHG